MMCSENVDDEYILNFDICATNHTTNDITIIGKNMISYYELSQGWYRYEYHTDGGWDNLDENSNMFVLNRPSKIVAGYNLIAPDKGMNEEGTAIAVIVNLKTNYLISIEKEIAELLFPELTNTALVYGFSYLKYDKKHHRETMYLRSDLIPDMTNMIITCADYVINIYEEHMQLDVVFHSGRANVTTNLSYNK